MNLPSLWCEWSIEAQLESLHQLILDSHLRRQCVVCVPLLGECKTVFLNFVLGLQRAEHFAGVLVGVTGAGEFHAAVGLCLQVQLPQAEVVAFAEDVACIFAQVWVSWRRHDLQINVRKWIESFCFRRCRHTWAKTNFAFVISWGLLQGERNAFFKFRF